MSRTVFSAFSHRPTVKRVNASRAIPQGNTRLIPTFGTKSGITVTYETLPNSEIYHINPPSNPSGRHIYHINLQPLREAPGGYIPPFSPSGRHPGGYIPLFPLWEAPW